jgi:hypothetical protein
VFPETTALLDLHELQLFEVQLLHEISHGAHEAPFKKYPGLQEQLVS